MVRRNLSDEREQMLDEIKGANDVSGDADMLRKLIDDAYDDTPDGAVYDPTSERLTPLSTDEIRDICWRYDAPAINPNHVRDLPRNRPDKADLMAAIARFEIVHGEDVTEAKIERVIADTVGEGDLLTVPQETGSHMDTDVRRRRNIYYYLDDVLAKVRQNPPKNVDNYPATHGIDGVDSVDGWMEQARDLLDTDDTVDVDEYILKAAEGRKIRGRIGDGGEVSEIINKLEDAAE